MSAFTYLVWTTWRNRSLATLRRIRSPRYAIALLAGAAYLWTFLFRPVGGSTVTSIFLGQTTEMLVTIFVVLTLAGPWVFGADTTALAFTPAEVSLLFPAPLSRRSLIRYKLFRSQIVVLLNALIWVFVLRRGGGPLPAPYRAIALWVLFSVMSLHRLGAALVRSSWREYGAAGIRRNRWSIAVVGGVVAAVVWSVVAQRAAFSGADGFASFLDAAGTVLASAPASWVLAPFHAVVAPTFAARASAWAHAMPVAVVVLAAHAWWVLRSDAHFEDAAIEASAERARRIEAMRARRSVGVVAPARVTRPAPRLAASGAPAMAILWKNLVCLRRTAQLRLFIGPVGMGAVTGVAFGSENASIPAMVAVGAATTAVMLVVIGSRLVRNDLRHDMQYLALLKSLPVAPGDLMVAEVASSALPMAAAQWMLLLVAYVAALFWPEVPMNRSLRLALLVASPVAVVALSGALLTIQNAIAVLFPAWIRIGTTVTTGVEALGQNLLGLVASLVALGVGLVLPGLAGLAIMILPGRSDPLFLMAATVVGAGLLAAETYLVLRVLGRSFAKAEPA